MLITKSGSVHRSDDLEGPTSYLEMGINTFRFAYITKLGMSKFIPSLHKLCLHITVTIEVGAAAHARTARARTAPRTHAPHAHASHAHAPHAHAPPAHNRGTRPIEARALATPDRRRNRRRGAFLRRQGHDHSESTRTRPPPTPQGRDNSELPEQSIVACRIHGLDLTKMASELPALPK